MPLNELITALQKLQTRPGHPVVIGEIYIRWPNYDPPDIDGLPDEFSPSANGWWFVATDDDQE